jgi:hypothetical protein
VDSVTATFSGMGPKTVDVFEYEGDPVRSPVGNSVAIPGEIR